MKILKIALIVYGLLLFFLAFPYMPTAVPYDCEKFRRVDYVFPARQMFCWLNVDMNQ